eukprot:6104907-Heterocapsa_arctica.AAC.1
MRFAPPVMGLARPPYLSLRKAVVWTNNFFDRAHGASCPNLSATRSLAMKATGKASLAHEVVHLGGPRGVVPDVGGGCDRVSRQEDAGDEPGRDCQKIFGCP